MNWKELLQEEIDAAYGATEKLMDLVEKGSLAWKPSAGVNWMSVGQLLKHITESCGACFCGFVTGDWGLPEGIDPGKLSPNEMLPPAEKMPTVESLDEAKNLLAEDKRLALDMLAKCSEEELATSTAAAPWDPRQKILGHRLLQMVGHLTLHKAQLFYYLKLQGKPVNTASLFGMG